MVRDGRLWVAGSYLFFNERLYAMLKVLYRIYIGFTQTPSNTTQSTLNVSFSSLRCKTKYRFQSKPLHQAERGRTLCSKEFLLAQPRLPTRRKLEGRGRKVTQKRPHADQLQDGFSAQAIASRQPS